MARGGEGDEELLTVAAIQVGARTVLRMGAEA